MSEFLTFIDEHLPALIVLVPLIGGALCIAMGRLVWPWAMLVVSAVSALCVRLVYVLQTQEITHLSYAFGDWPPPWGIEIRPDGLSSFVLAVVSAMAVVSTFYARRSVAKEVHLEREPYFYCLWILSLTGLLGITITGDAFNVYVLLEISSLTLYGLIALGKDRDRRALPSALSYLVLGSIGATFILLGIGYLYMATGTLNIQDMALRLPQVAESRTVLTAFAFLMVGLSLKMALFPMHTWLPNAYTYAPSAVSSFVAATATKVGIYMAIRFVYSVFADPSFASLKIFNSLVLMTCASLGIVFGAVQAVRQQNLKKMLAYSSVSQIGYIVLGFAIANLHGVQGAVVHILNHAVTKGALFMVMGAVIYRVGGASIRDFRGLGRRMPWTMAAFTVGGLGLIGIPGTAGFISKWYLVRGVLDAELWPLGVIILIGSVLAVIYVWRVVEAIYFGERESDDEAKEAPLSMLLSIWLLIGASVYLGFHSPLTVKLAETAATGLF